MAKQIIIINDTHCKAELDHFLRSNQDSLIWTGMADSDSREVTVPHRLLIRTSESITVVMVADLVRCQSNRNYTELYFRDGKRLVMSKTLKTIEELLQPAPFFRIHKSHLIHLTFLHRFIRSDGGRVELLDGTRLPVSTRKRDLLVKRLQRFQNESYLSPP